MEGRGVDSLLGGLSRLYARFRCLGINVMRLHSNREKGMLSKRVSNWCGHRHLVQTFTQGDDPQANGRAEAEVQQVKRRMRLILHQPQVEPELWPGAIRHATEERCRQQLSRLGVPVQPMLRFGSKVAVRTKRWHKAGQLVPKKPEVKEETEDVEMVAGDEQAPKEATAEPTSFDKKEDVQQNWQAAAEMGAEGLPLEKREWPKLSNQD